MEVTDTTHKLLKLLSQVIVADGHIFESEIEALVDCGSAIDLRSNSGVPLKPDDIRGWFADHAEELSAFKAADNSDVQLTRLILSLADWPEKQGVVDALDKISRADGEIHIEEKLLLSIVKAYWQYDGLDSEGSTIET